MIKFFKNPNEKIAELAQLDKEQLLYKVVPRFMMEVMTRYFRLEVEGLENIPRRGPGIVLPNHSGYSGFDAFVLAYEIHRQCRRVPRVLTHPLWFWTKTTAVPATKLGFFEATTANGLKFLNERHLIMLFPEGERGNFKPTRQRYRLQEFKRGFVRMALKTGAPILPSLVIGAEETHINIHQLKFTKYLIGAVFPLPLNVIPLPARWRIKFLEPIYLPYKANRHNDTELVHEIAADVRERMQFALNQELKKRDSIYL